MTLQEIREKFVALSGRRDLVTPSGGDNGADFFVNAGQRHLDLLQPSAKSIARNFTLIPVSSYMVEVQDCYAVKEVWISKADARTQLTLKSIQWLRANYGEPFSSVTTGAITAFADGGGGQVTVTSVGHGRADSDILTISGTTNYNATYTISGVTPDTFNITALWVADDGTGTWHYNATLIDVGTPLYYAVNIVGLAPAQSAFAVSGGSFNGMVGYQDIIEGDHFRYTGLVIMPPPDVIYTIETIGYFLSKRLVVDADISFWSVGYPEILVFAALYALELFYRNNAGANEWLSKIDIALRGIDRNMVEQEITECTFMEGNTEL